MTPPRTRTCTVSLPSGVGGRPGTDPSTDAVLRDLVDALVQEGLVTVDPPGPDGWGRIGPLHASLRPGGRLQPWRLRAGPLRGAGGAPVPLPRVLAALGVTGEGTAAVADDLVSAVEHHAELRSAFAAHGPVDLVFGERLAALRGRPFHPTGRAVTGWGRVDVAAFGPMRADPLAVAWVAARRDRLRLGPDARSGALHRELLSDHDVEALAQAMAEAGVGDDFQPLPVHPWQAYHVLPRAFAAEIERGDLVPLVGWIGRFRPTVSLRTLARADAVERHLKLPLGVATLGAARLLPPRYLDNGDRAERLLRRVVDSVRMPDGLVTVCDEGCWVGWQGEDDEFADRPGHLAAQVRRYPDGALDGLALPMAALAADGWDHLEPAIGFGDPVAFFAGLADAFAAMTVAFLGQGVLPELHGQNVVVRFAPDGRVAGLVLRDHDTVRVHAPWLRAAGLPDPGYRVRPGARQTLVLDTPSELVGYAQTLGFQVNLYGIADSLARRYDLDERELWACLRGALQRALAGSTVPRAVAAEIGELVLDARRWPSRTVLGPLIDSGSSSSVSMPAGWATVPNPLCGTGAGM